MLRPASRARSSSTAIPGTTTPWPCARPGATRDPSARQSRRSAGNATLENTTRNALSVLTLLGRTDIPVAAGAANPLSRTLETAPHVHGDSGLEGADLPRPNAEPIERRRGRVHRASRSIERRTRDACADRPADQRRHVPTALPGDCTHASSASVDGRVAGRGQHHAVCRVQHLGRSRGRSARCSAAAGR